MMKRNDRSDKFFAQKEDATAKAAKNAKKMKRRDSPQRKK
jgi:hypothetical protein